MSGTFSQQFSDALHSRIVTHMRQIGIVVTNLAEQFAPKKTGRLATSISYQLDESNYTLTFLVGAPYGIFQEFGTRHIRPHPFLRPALNRVPEFHGIQTEMAFLNTPVVHAPIHAAGAGFHLPSSLTTQQVQHVRTHLTPTSKRHFVGNVSRSKLRVRHFGS